LEDIRNSANKEGVSVNAFVNLILVKWTNSYKYNDESNAVTLTAKNFRAHLEHIDEDVFVNEFKDNAVNLVPAILADRKIPLTLNNLIHTNTKHLEYTVVPFSA
jgi:hypothetical protein